MSDKRPVVVYGASGYTGRLVCEYLRDLSVPFIAAGRDKARVQSVMDKIPGIETADYEVVGVEHNVESLTKLFKGAKVVSNMVGPFRTYGPDAVEASLAAGCHYTDTTGEQDWYLTAQARWGSKFAEKGLLLSPGMAQMYSTGEIAANICLETPGVDKLDILVLWSGFPTVGSIETIFGTLKPVWYYLDQNKYVAWDHHTAKDAVVPGMHETCIVVPWGGTGHPVWFKDDPRVTKCRALGGVFDRTVMDGWLATVKMFEEQLKSLPEDQQLAKLSEIAASVQAGMPPRESPQLNISVDSVHASGPLAHVHCVIYGTCNYKQTGLLQAYAAMSLMQQAPKRVGFASACQAFGHRQLLGVLMSFGLVQEPIVTIHN